MFYVWGLSHCIVAGQSTLWAFSVRGMQIFHSYLLAFGFVCIKVKIVVVPGIIFTFSFLYSGVRCGTCMKGIVLNWGKMKACFLRKFRGLNSPIGPGAYVFQVRESRAHQHEIWYLHSIPLYWILGLQLFYNNCFCYLILYKRMPRFVPGLCTMLLWGWFCMCLLFFPPILGSFFRL